MKMIARRFIALTFRFLLVCMLDVGTSIAQVPQIPRDEYFTTEKVYQKLIKTFPFIQKPNTTLPDNVKLVGNVVYKKIGTRELRLDIFSPINKSSNELPCILIFHGGGWRSGSKEMEHPLAAKIASFGVVAICVEYRLTPEAKYPAAVLDAKTSVRWIRKFSEKYHVDKSRVYILGASAGALLATLVGVTDETSVFPKDDTLNTADRVDAIVNIDGEVDFTHPDACDEGQNSGKPSSASKWFGSNFIEAPNLWKEASPINYVSINTPSIFFINSSIKENHAGQEEMIQKLKKHKVIFDVKTFENTPHPFWLFDPWFSEYTIYLREIISKLEQIKAN